MKGILTEPYFYAVSFISALLWSSYLVVAGLTGKSWMTNSFGWTATQASTQLMSLSLALVVGSPILSALSDSLKSRRFVVIGASIVTSLLSFWFAFISEAAEETTTTGVSQAALFVALVLYGIASSAIMSILYTTVKELFPVALAGTAVGALNIFPFLICAICQTVHSAILKSIGGDSDPTGHAFAVSWAIMGVFGVLALVLAIASRETHAAKVGTFWADRFHSPPGPPPLPACLPGAL
eukprot:gnl/Ergobibamus_cyprinoides/1391.p1 GENE.gnl/Ergobibamus_cyprinoides/1391~~gnl/Ergobibamus_cyprinoides/1391.p1  ORF type:complete len:239 (-),score=105.25 gnl/Ergobibamus_cyprinoides/1391:65-781(-)